MTTWKSARARRAERHTGTRIQRGAIHESNQYRMRKRHREVQPKTHQATALMLTPEQAPVYSYPARTRIPANPRTYTFTRDSRAGRVQQQQ